MVLPPEADAADYCAVIGDLWHEESAYNDMRAAARSAYEARLNWRVWGDAMEAAFSRA